MPFDYFTDRRDDRIGLVRVAGWSKPREGPNCLLFDNGDTFQGSMLGDLAARGRLGFDDPHPMIVAMNALGYDAATLGNHDFDYGIGRAEPCPVLLPRSPLCWPTRSIPATGNPSGPATSSWSARSRISMAAVTPFGSA
jgi:hypothetical protein